jgi:aryl-alcohol dehydrogenase-like predicted oxidoreductase
MSFGSKSWQDWVIEDEDKVFELLQAAYDAGIRTWDTADVYSQGESERLIGKFLKTNNIPRSTMTILTKVMFPMNIPGRERTAANMLYRYGLSRKHILDAVDESVERLGTYIDVYQIHRLDHEVDKVEIMEALNDCVRSGKVRYIGASSMKAIEFAQLQFIAEQRGWAKFISMQNFYNLIYREEEREMIPFCNETGVGLIPWSPIARGVLARPLDSEESARATAEKGIHDRLKLGEQPGDEHVVKRVEKLAIKRGVSMAVIATAWVLSKGACPIAGFNKVERIYEAVEAVKIKLDDSEIAYLEEPYKAHEVVGTEVAARNVLFPWIKH